MAYKKNRQEFILTVLFDLKNKCNSNSRPSPHTPEILKAQLIHSFGPGCKTIFSAYTNDRAISGSCKRILSSYRLHLSTFYLLIRAVRRFFPLKRPVQFLSAALSRFYPLALHKS